MSLVVRCPNCKGHNELEEEDLRSSSLHCPLCHISNPVEEYSVMTFCPHCHQKLAIPADMIYEEELYCAKCDRPFNPNTSISLSSNNVDDFATDITMYSGQEETTQLYHAQDYFDKYQIISLLGKGGMGEVYLAKHLLLNKNVAIKIMLASAAAKNPVVAKRFIREAKIANQIDTPNIVKVYDAGLDQKSNQLFISMEYVDGKNLSQLLASNGVFSEKDTLEIALEVCNALQKMETAGIVHRDIKPSNIMITSNHVVKLADLGIAKANNSQIQEELTLTSNNVVFGTPNYASPEQCKSSHNTDTRSDIYSLGATMFCMVASIAPFNGTNPVDTMFKVINEEPEDLLALAPNLSPSFVKLIYDMINKDPNKRPQNINELTSRIKDCLGNKVTISKDTTPIKVTPLPQGPTLYKVKDHNNNIVKPDENWEQNYLDQVDDSSKNENIVISFFKEMYNSAKTIYKYSFLTLKYLTIFILIYFGLATVLAYKNEVPMNVQLSKMGLPNWILSYFFDHSDLSMTSNNKTPQTYPKLVDKEEEELQKFVKDTLAKAGTKESSTSYVLSKEEFIKAYRRIFANVQGTYTTLEGRLAINNQILSSDVFTDDSLRHDPFIKAIYQHNKKANELLTQQYARKKAALAEKSQYSQSKTAAAIDYLSNLTYMSRLQDRNQLSQKLISYIEDKEIDLSATFTIQSRSIFLSYYFGISNDKKSFSIAELILYDFSYGRLSKTLLPKLMKRNFPPFNKLFAYNENILEHGVEDLSSVFKLTTSNYRNYEKLFLNYPNLNEQDKNKNNILHRYTYYKKLKNVLMCLYSPIDINCQNIEGETPLFIAEKQGPVYLRDLLIHFGADESIKNITNEIAKDYRLNGEILSAIEDRDQDTIIKILKEKPVYKINIPSINYNYSSSQLNLLVTCCRKNLDKVLAYLIEEKVDILDPENTDNTSLISIIDYATPTDINAAKNIYKLLLDNGSNVLYSSSSRYQTTKGTNTGLWALHLQNNRREDQEYLYKELLAHYSNDLYAKAFLEMFFVNEPLHSIYVDQIITHRTEFNALAQNLLANGGPIDWNNEEIKKLIPEVLASHACDVENLKLLSQLNCNILTLDSNGKNALYNTLKKFEELYKKYHNLFTNNSKNLKLQKNYQKFMKELREKCQYLKSLGLTVNRSDFNISNLLWNTIYE